MLLTLVTSKPILTSSLDSSSVPIHRNHHKASVARFLNWFAYSRKYYLDHDSLKYCPLVNCLGMLLHRSNDRRAIFFKQYANEKSVQSGIQ